MEKFSPLDLRKAATTIDRIGKGGLLYGLVPMFLLHNLEAAANGASVPASRSPPGALPRRRRDAPPVRSQNAASAPDTVPRVLPLFEQSR